MDKQHLGVLLVLAAVIQICFAAKIYRLSRRKTLEQSNAYDAKIDQVKKLSVRVQLGCFSLYGLYLCYECFR
jgi:hypothetical protein